MKESRNTAHKASKNKKSPVLSVISSSGRRLCLITLILILCAANLLSGCGQNAIEETTAATEAATLTTEDGFVFETGLPEKQDFPLSKNGKTYYVAADGVPGSDGLSPETPITIAEVGYLDLGPGDSVLFKKGDLFNGSIYISDKSGTEDNPITIASYGYGDKKPHIHNDGNSNTVDIRKCSNIVIRDLEISVVGADHTEGTGSVAGINLQYDMIGETKYENIYVVNNEVHGTDVEKNVMGITLSSCCDDIATRPINGVSNINVLNNTVYDVGRSGINAFGWIIEISGTNTFHDTFKDICITGNTVHNVGNIGIFIAGCTGSELNRNTVYNSGMRENAAGSEGMCGIMVLGCSTSDIMFNVCYDNQRANGTYDAMGIDIDWNCTNINVQYNHCYENDGAGIGTMACQNSFIRNNRIENNRCITNNEGQINLMDFTSRNHGVAEDMHKVKNLTVENNLVIGTPEGTAFFRVKHENGDFYHENNSFKNNRIVYTGSEGSLITWIEIDAGLSWYEFSRNRYYSADNLSVFNCMDYSKKALINTENGANRYSGKRTAFEDWLQREPDAQFSAVTEAIPSAPENIDVSWSQGKLNLTWDAASGDLWHYNIYSLAENEEISYLNMLGETEGTEFSFAPEYTGTFRIVVQAESNEGICSDLAQAKVTLK